jgi:hypothetical protein
VSTCRPKCLILISRVADPHHFLADPDPAFYFKSGRDPDPAFCFNADPDSAPHQSDGSLRGLV